MRTERVRRAPAADEPGTRTYRGATVEHALAAARAAHGPAVQVLRAVRRTRGLRGFGGSTSVELVVRGGEPLSASRITDVPVRTGGDDAVHDALSQLLDRAERHERRATGTVTGPAPTAAAGELSWQQNDVQALLDELGERRPTAGPGARSHPAPALARHSARSPSADHDPTAVPAAAPLRPATGDGRAHLRNLGLPAVVLSRLPVEEPADLADWRRALCQALSAVVPPPASVDEQHPIVISGYGVLGAVAIVSAATQGATPGHLSTDGRRRPATAAHLADVLADALRAAVDSTTLEAAERPRIRTTVTPRATKTSASSRPAVGARALREVVDTAAAPPTARPAVPALPARRRRVTPRSETTEVIEGQVVHAHRAEGAHHPAGSS